jgi:hypothetical protein
MTMRRSVPCLLLAILLLFGCSSREASAPPPAQEPPAQAAARCGGSGGFDVSGLTAVLADAESPHYTAVARQAVKIKPGVEVKPKLDEKGATVVVTLALNNSSADLTCRCPDGCGGSCSLILDASDPDFVECVGDCRDGDVCCFGCGLYQN